MLSEVQDNLQFFGDSAVDEDDEYDDTTAHIFWALLLCYLNFT